jgi:predicted DNA-binding transcriptional regulator AlpA
MKDNKYIDEKEVSRITGLALPTLRNYRHLGKGPKYSKIGRCVRYSLDDVIAFMESCKVDTARV